MVGPFPGVSARLKITNIQDVLDDMRLLQQVGTPLDRVDYRIIGPGGYVDIGLNDKYASSVKAAIALKVAENNQQYVVFREIK